MAKTASGGEYVVGISGASGSALALVFLEQLAARTEARIIHLIVSPRALIVARSELSGSIRTGADFLSNSRLSTAQKKKIRLHDPDAIAAPISSGSYPVEAMVIVPCSAGTLGAIASGVSRGLMQRAADVQLKQRRPLVLAFRESPLSLIHAENIRTMTLAGAIVAPPVPPWYLKNATLEMHLEHMAVRLLDLCGLVPGRSELRWGGKRD